MDYFGWNFATHFVLFVEIHQSTWFEIVLICNKLVEVDSQLISFFSFVHLIWIVVFFRNEEKYEETVDSGFR